MHDYKCEHNRITSRSQTTGGLLATWGRWGGATVGWGGQWVGGKQKCGGRATAGAGTTAGAGATVGGGATARGGGGGQQRGRGLNSEMFLKTRKRYNVLNGNVINCYKLKCYKLLD